MKHSFLIAFFLLFAIYACASIWHVNLDPSAYADFNQINTAVADAAVTDGDTLYVYGSTQTYSPTYITKSLTIIGTGYFLGSNPGLQHSTLGVNVGEVYIQAPNITLMGLTISFNMQVLESNATIVGCSIRQVRIYHSNALFKGCFFWDRPSYVDHVVQLSNATNIIFTNCYFGYCWNHKALLVPSNSSATVCYSVIRGNTSISNTEFYNNIVYCGHEYNLSFESSGNLHHNVFVADNGINWSEIITGENNLLDYDGPLFAGGDSPDGKYQLIDDPANLALTAGIFGGECGMFGGLTPYELSGIPPIPTIYELNVPTVGNTLPVQVKARSNN